jgi:hypothetical protein
VAHRSSPCTRRLPREETSAKQVPFWNQFRTGAMVRSSAPASDRTSPLRRGTPPAWMWPSYAGHRAEFQVRVIIDRNRMSGSFTRNSPCSLGADMRSKVKVPAVCQKLRFLQTLGLACMKSCLHQTGALRPSKFFRPVSDNLVTHNQPACLSSQRQEVQSNIGLVKPLRFLTGASCLAY